MSDRLEREIEEILDKIDQFPAPETRRARARKRALRRLGSAIADRQRSVMRELSRVSISQVMLASFLLILGSFFFRRFSPLFMQWALYAGIVLFISSFAILVFSRGAGRSSVQTRWRGREIAYPPAGPSVGQRLRRWLRARRTTR
jgi:hypothetical protein